MTFVELKAKVIDYLNRADIAAALQGELINMAMHKIERKNNFRHMKCRTTLSLTNGNHTYSNPVSNYKEIITAHIIDSDGLRYQPLDRKFFADAISRYPDLTNDKSRPTIIAEVPTAETANLSPDAAPTHQWIFRPTPDESYTCDIQAYQYSPDLSATITTNWWTQNAWEILLYGALVEAEMYLVNDARMPMWKDNLKEALNDMFNAEKIESIAGSPQSIQGVSPYARAESFNILRGY